MINLILLFPLVACLILFIFKKSFLNTWLINLYAMLHVVAATGYCCGVELLPMPYTPSFFLVTNKNVVFLAVMSLVFLAVAIYNNAYIKNEQVTDRKARHYAYMVLFFVFSMTGAILSTNLGLSWVFIEGTTLASAYLIFALSLLMEFGKKIKDKKYYISRVVYSIFCMSVASILLMAFISLVGAKLITEKNHYDIMYYNFIRLLH